MTLAKLKGSRINIMTLLSDMNIYKCSEIVKVIF